MPAIVETAPQKLADGFKFTEGPLWIPEGYIIFSDIPNDRICKWSEAKGVEVWRQGTNKANGLALDPQGRVVACDQNKRCIDRYEPDGTTTTLAERWHGKRFNKPNDVAVRSDGYIYFSDPGMGIKDEEREIKEQAFYCIRPDGEVLQVATGYDKPNGLAFSPDEKILYLNDTGKRIIDAYDVKPDGTLTNKRLFADLASEEKKGNPDGMKVDSEGNVYCTGPGAVWIYDAQGKLLGKMAVPELAANLCFGDADHKSLYLTARAGLYRARVKIPGAVPGGHK